MITLYTWSTPNGRKVSIALEELGLDYDVKRIDITKGEQHAADFLAISPNNKIPAIVDEDGPDGHPIALFESGAILIYLAEKCGRLLPTGARERLDVLQWLMMQMGSVGPMMGQAHHFLRFAPEDVPYAKKRYSDETRRIYGVLDRRLAEHEWLAAGEYTIADIATFPWIARHEWQQVALEDFPNVKRWFDAIAARPAVARGMQVPG
ncbi:glutathione S-transferase family protein [Pseudazoarcus pumilus]|uniref:Glutathione S-transferase n=1 Tax=Pseudazoarcus pumilus TaxID=2067960 RepID=A0A2I6S9I7_9RHOO|nr:glutathione binding-like protein [Pseudazoarcus pumilus]AUN95926.1 glutathione S-transferase [Pseudazoarcus pumilus]